MNEPPDLDAIRQRAHDARYYDPNVNHLVAQGTSARDVPALLAEITRLRAENETLRSELDTERHDREQRAAALYDARDALYRGEGPDVVADADIVYGEWLGNRADQIEATP